MKVDCIGCGDEVEVPDEKLAVQESVIVQCLNCDMFLEVESDGSVEEVTDEDLIDDDSEQDRY